MTSCIKSAFARRIRLLTLRNRFASPLFVIKEELRHIWKFWIARDRFTAPNFHSQVHEVTNFVAWSSCIGHCPDQGLILQFLEAAAAHQIRGQNFRFARQSASRLRYSVR